MRTFYWVVCLSILFSACKKQQPVLSSDKSITSFYFSTNDNPGMVQYTTIGIITGDTIFVKFKLGTPLKSLKPNISISGKSIIPAANAFQDFSQPVPYTVTAQDGSTKTYIVISSYNSTDKEITSFVLKSSENQDLKQDIIGKISGDSIFLMIDPTLQISHLKPSITFKGIKLSPNDSSFYDFSIPQYFTVNAEDGTSIKYTVIAGSNSLLYIGSMNGQFYSLNALNGSVNWVYQAGGGIQSSPTYYNGIVYFGCLDGNLYALNAATGNLLWKFYADGFPVSGSPVVKDGTIYFIGYSNSGNIYALDANSGTLMWKNLMSYGTSPSVWNNLVYCGSGGYGTYAYEVTTGNLLWKYGSGISKSRPAIVNGILYGGGEVYAPFAINAQNDSLLWRDPDNNVISCPTIGAGRLYAGVAQTLNSYDSATGTMLWQYSPYGVNSNGIFSSPVYYNQMVFSNYDNNITYALDAATGLLKWSFNDGTKNGAGLPELTVCNGVLYTGTQDNNIFAIYGATGQPIWKFQANAPVFSGPCVVDINGNTFFAANSGNHK